MKIPTSFQVVNRKYTVEKMAKELSEDLHKFGDVNKSEGLIRILIDNPANAEHTFYHELMHVLLEASTKPKLSNKEDFVDSLAAGLHQYMQTKKGQLQ